MKRFLFLLTGILFLLPFAVDAQEVNIYLFYGNGCPHCKALETYLDTEYKKDEEITVYKYEVWFDKIGQEALEKAQAATGEEPQGVPYFIIGDQVYQGYNEGPAWEETVDKAISNAKENGYVDEVGVALGITKESEKDKTVKKQEPNKQKKEHNTIDVPLIGTVNLKNLSLPVIAIIIGIVDGFNPCAMWILIFLITLLLDYKDRKKMWILGCTFLFTSAFVYFLFMMGFLRVATFLNTISILKYSIAAFALIFGGYNVYRYIKTRKDAGCDVVNKDQRKKIMTKTKKVVSTENFALALIGIMVLAVSVNLLELLCSLGLPVVFTEILSINNIKGVAKVLYILLYVFFFLIDDLIVFFIAMKTLKIKAISNKYTKYSHLIGGIIMIVIGLLMIFKYEWLMFNF